MSMRAWTLTTLLVAALAVGTISDVPKPSVARQAGGYHILAADFHVHSFPFTWSTLSPWDTVIEAHYQGLDVLTMTPHQHVWAGKFGRWFSRGLDRPLVIVGQEIVAREYHMIAAGISDMISGTLPTARAIEEVHRQGGVAIAAHPYGNTWKAYDVEAMRTLDGAEIVRPEAQHDERMAVQLREFFNRGSFTPIGSSDYHGVGLLGYCRTYVFARTRTAQGVIDAVREGRTVVFDRDRAYGDAALIQLASTIPDVQREIPRLPVPGAARLFSRLATLLVLVAVLCFNRW
jgi:predicted metal-dependent phosphoesterase TrpH